ncbi:hypothetical protein BGZ83_003956 [Gryganskiella cystojenkinii]|nr:hypothetical protein BGZ83_003956 [Gryganskiella cystojenkinii]
MTDHEQEPSATLTLEEDHEDLPEDDNQVKQTKDDDAPLVNLVSLNPAYRDIELKGRRTTLGRNPDADAVIWIKDVSSNGVWINQKKIARDEPTKIHHRDIITFTYGPVHSKPNAPAFMLMDKRSKSEFKEQQQLHAKRVSDKLEAEDSSSSGCARPEAKRPKLNENDSGDKTQKETAAEKAKEDSAFEKEFECSICHEIMYKPLVLQPCMHSFCRECCKLCLRNSPMCPTCRQPVTKTKRDFKLNNLIELFLKTRPQLARDDLEDGGAESDSSNVIRAGNNYDEDEHEDDGDEDDDNEDEDNDDDHDNGGNHFVHNLLGYAFGAGAHQICPCCDPNNVLGYTCPDAVRLRPLGPHANHMEYQNRLRIQPGHSQCRNCNSHLPIVDLNAPGREAIADKFRCKMCHVPSCGCMTRSVDDNIAAPFMPISGYFNPSEDRIIQGYMLTEGISAQSVWQAVRDGMNDGTFHYLGAATVPTPAPVALAVAATPDASTSNAPQPGASTSTDNSGGSNNTDIQAAAGTSASGAVAGAAGPAAAISTPATNGVNNATPTTAAATAAATLNTRGANVTSSDKLCRECARDFFSNGPLYQWRKNLDPNLLPPRVVARSDCWYGRECRTQFNRGNPAHAERLNHICEKINRP